MMPQWCSCRGRPVYCKKTEHFSTGKAFCICELLRKYATFSVNCSLSKVPSMKFFMNRIFHAGITQTQKNVELCLWQNGFSHMRNPYQSREVGRSLAMWLSPRESLTKHRNLHFCVLSFTISFFALNCNWPRAIERSWRFRAGNLPHGRFPAGILPRAAPCAAPCRWMYVLVLGGGLWITPVQPASKPISQLFSSFLRIFLTFDH